MTVRFICPTHRNRSSAHLSPVTHASSSFSSSPVFPTHSRNLSPYPVSHPVDCHHRHNNCFSSDLLCSLVFCFSLFFYLLIFSSDLVHVLYCISYFITQNHTKHSNDTHIASLQKYIMLNKAFNCPLEKSVLN